MAGENLTLYTRTIDREYLPRRYSAGTYQRIVGVAADGQTLWIPRTSAENPEQQVFKVPGSMARNVMRYVQEYHTSNPNKQWSCHVAAAAICGAGFLNHTSATRRATDI